MDRLRLQHALEGLKAFLLSKLSREAFVFVFFMLVSAVFWLLLTLNETYEMDVEVPLELTGVPAEAVLTTELPPSVQVRVRDKGSVLIGYYGNGRNRKITFDFKSFDHGETFQHVVVKHADVQKRLQACFDGSTHFVSIRPDTLEFYYTRGHMKRVPVNFRGHVQPAPLYYLASLRCQPDSVTVWAQESYLDSLTEVSTVVTNINGITETTERKVALPAVRGVKFEPAEVRLVAEVDVFTEKQVEVPVVGTNFPAGLSLRPFPATAVVAFRVGSKDYKRITRDQFVITATYEELMALPDSMLTLKLRSVPEGVSQVRIQPQRVQFLIEQTEE